MLTFLRKAFGFVARPSHSRTLGLVLMLVLVAAVSLTVYVAQQQQETRQRASGSDKIISYSPERRNPDPDLANVAGNFGCKEGYHVISPEICCPSGTIYCNLPKDNPVNLCADDTDACNALIETRLGIPDCGDNLKCDASTISGACSAGQNKCLSSKGFGGAEKASPNGKSVVCCNVPPTPTPTQLASSSLCNPDCKDNEACTPYDDPGGLTGYSCVRTPVVCGANNGQSFGTCTGSDICQQFGNSQFSDGIRYECVSATTPTPTPNCGTATCKTGQVCLRNQIGEAGPGTRIDICVSPTPTPICGTLGGQCCSTTPECQQGTFCSGNTCINATIKTPTPTAIVCLKSNGDANCDGKINITDFNIWRDEFKKYLTSSTADFNKDGRITIVDFNILRDGLKNTNLPHQ